MVVLDADGADDPRSRDPHPGVVLADAPDAPARSDRRASCFRIFLVLLALTFVLRFPAFFAPVFNSDETFLATQAHVIERRRRALRGGHRPQAAARALRLRGHVRVLRHDGAVVGARRGDARGRAHRAARSRSRAGVATARARDGSRGSCSWSRWSSFVPQDGQAANFEVFMLPSMTAAILFARRGRGAAPGSRSPPRRSPNRPARPRCSRSCTCIARARGKRGVGEVFARLQHPDRDRRPGRGSRASSCTGRCSATARTSA